MGFQKHQMIGKGHLPILSKNFTVFFAKLPECGGGPKLRPYAVNPCFAQMNQHIPGTVKIQHPFLFPYVDFIIVLLKPFPESRNVGVGQADAGELPDFRKVLRSKAAGTEPAALTECSMCLGK